MGKISEYADKQLQTALHLLQEYNAASDEELLHQLRVSLKKIQAVLNYLKTVHPAKAKSFLKDIKPVFHAAGSVRELQLHINWLQKNRYTLLIDTAALRKKLTEENEMFAEKKADWKKRLLKLQPKLKKRVEHEEEYMKQYFSSVKEQVVNFSLTEGTKSWHKYRKQIKQLLYAQHWLTEGERLKLLPVKLCKRYDCLQEAIGLWHDSIERELRLENELYYLNPDKKIREQFIRCRLQLKKEYLHHVKIVKKILADN